MIRTETMLLDPGLLSRLIGRALSRGGDFSEVYVQRRKSVGFSLDDGLLRDAQASRDFGVGIRVIKGTSVTYAWSDDTSDAALLACADAAAHVDGGDEPLVLARPLGRNDSERSA